MEYVGEKVVMVMVGGGRVTAQEEVEIYGKIIAIEIFFKNLGKVSVKLYSVRKFRNK